MDLEAGKKNFDWEGKYLQQKKDSQIADSSSDLSAFMAEHDRFLPACLSEFAEADLDRLLGLADAVYQEAQNNGFYLLYYQLIRKMIILVLEQFPEKFEALSETQKDQIFGTKIEFPTEEELYKKLYVYLLGKEPLPLDMMATGVSLRRLLQRLMASQPEIIDQRLVDLICATDSQYSTFYSGR